LFRLDRVDRLEILDERFELGPRHESTRNYERDVSGFPEARIRFDRAVLRWVRERQPILLLREEHDGEGNRARASVRVRPARRAGVTDMAAAVGARR